MSNKSYFFLAEKGRNYPAVLRDGTYELITIRVFLSLILMAGFFVLRAKPRLKNLGNGF